MEWTPLIEATYFTGIRTDLLTTVIGIASCLLIVVRPAGFLHQVFRS
ncbi:hypothetical protein SAMN02745124_04067 [Desulfofustis glycolicus DSM 9705]|uniref:Uncharacterized protein n=1 Tax=Desulfofustis glycolicus DSM 9705 TaxID=1121409 RepID=A0A1M5YI38_9BACT|nr:hypothetical protein SAMN02745124_04067 [Desulfofustis glycolicus DSM 9705]